MTRHDMIAKGWLTETPHTTFTRPVEEAGHYQDAETGYWYNVAWRDGQLSVATVGYSAAYLALLADYERAHGPVMDRATGAAFDAWLDARQA